MAAVEGALLVAAVWLAHYLRFLRLSELRPEPGRILHISVLFAAVVLAALYWNRMYDLLALRTSWRIAGALSKSIGVATVVLWGIYYLAPAISPGRAVFVISLLLATLFLAGWRMLLLKLGRQDALTERVLIVGAGDSARRLSQMLLDRRHLGYQVVGHLADDPRLQGVSIVNPAVIGTVRQVHEVALRERVTRIVVAQSENRGRLNMNGLLDCKTSGIPVVTASRYIEGLTGKIPVEDLRPSRLVFSEGFVVSATTQISKRALDVVATSVGLLVTWPILLATALAIRLESPGPVLYRQKRVGKNGKEFTLWKFRSMCVKAERDGEAVWALPDDPRITRVGRWIRRTRIDELPQLWNVLRGEMSLVGPRPERREFVDQLIAETPFYEERFVVRPGLTGWAQLHTGYAASIEESVEKLAYDLFYLDNLSIFLDLAIVLRTARLVLQARLAR